MLRGEIIKLEEGKLSIKTAYAGTLTVDWGYVRALDSDKALWVTLIGESNPSERSLEGQATGVAVVEADGTSRQFSAVWPVAAIHLSAPTLADTWQVTGSLGVGLDASAGNDEELTISLDGEVNINDQWNKNTLRWEYETESDDDSTETDWGLAYDYSRYLDEHLYVQGSGSREFDSDADLRYRTSLGGSLGYRFWETKTRLLRSSVGFSRLWEAYEHSEYEKDIAVTWMVEYRAEFWEHMSYYTNIKTFYRLGSGETLVTLRQGVKWNITDELSLKLDHSLDYDSQTLSDVKDTDNQVKIGIGYQW